MTLGFSVDALVAQSRGSGLLRMGLTRVAEADWLQRDADRGARAAAFDRHPDSVAVLPESAAAGREVAAMLGVRGGLAEAARSTWEDLCLIDTAGAAPTLVAAAVAFPTDWRIADKIGRSIAAVHAPIHGYAAQLSAGVDHFLATLRPGPVFARANWFVVASGAWRYLPADPPETRFAHVTAANAGETLFVRCERQTLRRLPETGAILFTIGVQVVPLGTLADRTVARVAASVSQVGAGEHERRAGPHYASALAGYAATRQHHREAAA